MFARYSRSQDGRKRGVLLFVQTRDTRKSVEKHVAPVVAGTQTPSAGILSLDEAGLMRATPDCRAGAWHSLLERKESKRADNLRRTAQAGRDSKSRVTMGVSRSFLIGQSPTPFRVWTFVARQSVAIRGQGNQTNHSPFRCHRLHCRPHQFQQLGSSVGPIEDCAFACLLHKTASSSLWH